MSVRTLLISALVAFAVLVSALGGYQAWREASRAVESELDRTATWVAGAAAEVGLPSGIVAGLEPGMEDEPAFTAFQARLQRLRRYVREAYIIDRSNASVVSTFPADSVPIGMPLRILDAFGSELDTAWDTGNGTTPAFVGNDGLLYKWGFARLEQSEFMLAVLMQADYLSPLDRLKRNLILGSAVAAMLAAVLAALLAAGISEPLERLSRVALRIQRGHMSEPVAGEPGKELGRLSRAMERMRRGIQERDEQLRLMLAQVAHEIRNPLGGLELFAAAAGETEDPEERARLLKRVREEVSGLNGIIDDFLAFARPMSPTAEANDLREALLQAVELVRMEVQERGGVLEIDLPDVPLMARVGPDHAKRVVLNLLRNAAQAADRIHLSAGMRHGEVEVRVSDDGPGVPLDLRERIFDPFVTDKEQGAGLGLAIVRKVAEAHGGRVELVPPEETNGAGGAEFRVYFRSLEDPPTRRPAP